MNIKNFIVPLLIFLIGAGFYIIGVLLKILHWQFGFVDGSLVLIIASFVQILAIIVAIYKLILLYKKDKN